MIQVERLTKWYGGIAAIQDLDFEVGRGEIVGFLGPNGAGKTTTMRILCGSLGASSGRALIGGVDISQDPRGVKRQIGYLPEFPPLHTEMTVRAYLRYCGHIKGATDPKRATEEVIERVGLSEVSHRMIEHLSKGFRQRVGLAQALVHSPRVLVLDEPASGLDPAQRVEIRKLVKELAGGDTTVILSTHVLSEVEAVCERVIILNKGQIVAQDAVSALANAGRAVCIRVSRPSPELVAKLEGVASVHSVEQPDPGHLIVRSSEDVRATLAEVAVPAGLLELSAEQQLEDVFLHLTGMPRVTEEVEP